MQVRDPSNPTTTWTVVGRVPNKPDWIVCKAIIRRRNKAGTGFRNVESETVLPIADVEIIPDVALA
jgi:hypothetical protein